MDTSGGSSNPAQPDPQPQPALSGKGGSSDQTAGKLPEETGDEHMAQAGGRPFEQTQGKPASAKEQEFMGQIGASERVPIVEMREPRELPEEVAGWLERVQTDDVEEPKTVVHKGKTVVAPAAPQDVTVTLPLTESGVQQGLHQKIIESARWLAEWCFRLIKKFHGKVTYRMQDKGGT